MLSARVCLDAWEFVSACGHGSAVTCVSVVRWLDGQTLAEQPVQLLRSQIGLVREASLIARVPLRLVSSTAAPFPCVVSYHRLGPGRTVPLDYSPY